MQCKNKNIFSGKQNQCEKELLNDIYLKKKANPEGWSEKAR